MIGRALTGCRALLGGVIVTLVCLHQPLGLAAARGDDNVHDAGKHFQRGVTLYGEADYRGALVEFNRAYELAPNGAVLYNVGETQFQLRDYAGALITFQRYLRESGPGDGHRGEVETNVRELKSRVGRLVIDTVPRGAEIIIDDRVIGKTPFDGPVVVGIGRLRVTASLPDRAPVTREVDVSAEDDVSLTLQLPPPSGNLALVAPSAAAGPNLVDGDHEARSPGRSLRPLAWIGTGVLAAGAIGFGLLARHESSQLVSERAAYQIDTSAQYADAKRNRLDHLASLTTAYAITADSLAAAALVLGGITLLTQSGAGADAGVTHVSVGLASMDLRVTF